MRSLASPRSARGSSMLGSVNWAFVITLFLLLGIIFMWWSAADERDQAVLKRDEYSKALSTVSAEGLAIAEELDKTAKLMGFNTQTIAYKGGTYAKVDRAAAEQHLLMTGEVEISSPDNPDVKIKLPGTLNLLLNHLKVTIPVAVRSGDGAAVAKEFIKEVDFTWASQNFKNKLKEVSALGAAVPHQPQPPADTDDEAATAKYRADLEAYNRAVQAYNAAMTQLTGPDFTNEWKQFKQVISGVPFDPDTTKAYELNFRPKLVGNEAKTFQDLLALWKGPFDSILAEFKANKEADQIQIAKLNAEIGALTKSVEEEKKRFEDLRSGDQAELTRQKAEYDKVLAQSAANEQQARKAENDLQVALGEFKKQQSRSNAEMSAMRSRIASDKERADLEIRRDEVDGTLLSVSNTSQTGTISVGSSDKAYPGLKFVVSYVDRGGARQAVGQVQVIKVTGPHSSEVRVLDATQPLVTGHLISNPLFASGREIHIHPVGWTPDLIQSRRLRDMNVIVDAQPTAKTDFFVVPDDWKGGSAAPPAEGEEPAAAAAANPLDKAKLEAQTFGATVITFRMLDNFLRL
jgi:hypothetical protein